jgi:hypothetical protein
MTHTDTPLTAPFPYFGGKSRAASLIWSRFGASTLKCYAEPFLGSAAVFLQAPAEFRGQVTLNDKDGLLVNFWRAVVRHPDEVAEAATQPVFEADLHARHATLVNARERLTARLMGDPDYCEPKLAGWWAWGACVWIGGKWCSGNGPWNIGPDEEGFPVLQRFDGDVGVCRQLPHLGGAGKGVCRKLQSPDGDRLEWVTSWLRRLQCAFRDARVACGSWERICTPSTLTYFGTCAVLLDPPYSQTDAVYAVDDNSIAHEVRKWCIENGGNPLLRIALCGHAGEHEELERLGWAVATWKKLAGYSAKIRGGDDRERIWFSPHCIPSAEDLL